MAASKVGRNDPCPCGSGKKYKQCCEKTSDQMSRTSQFAVVAVVVAIAATLVYTFTGNQGTGGGRQVWDPDHGHYHTVP
jgi:hypothetical protein